MVFSSVSAYLDPSNWQPQHINHHIIGSSASNHLFPPQGAPAAAPPQPSPPQPHGGPGSGSGSIRPGFMSERARLANIPMPESALKCPRCESTNTKFCYFNNYSLSQPRHFCKTCRRYWTRGGALRSVPVGGGCRRNRRSSKSTASSKSSPVNSDNNNNNKRQTNSSPTGGSDMNNNIPTDYGGNLVNIQPQFQPMRFMSPLSQLSDSFAGDVGLNNYVSGNISAANDQMGFHGSASSLMGIEPWRLQQFPFLGCLDPSPPGVYQFHGDGESGFPCSADGEARPGKFSSSLLLSQMASVKMEDNRNPNDSSLSGGMQENHHHHRNHHDHYRDQWNMNNATGGVVWTDLSGFTSPSTSNHLQ